MDVISVTRFLFISYLAILPLANTTALRNLFILAMSFIFIFQSLTDRNKQCSELIKRIPHSMWLCAGFFVFFPWLSISPHQAFHELSGQWAQALLAWLCGFAYVICTKDEPSSFKTLALANAFIVGVYFIQLMLVLIGLYGSNGYAMQHIPIENTIAALRQAFSEGWSGWGGGIPFPFFGYDVMHGNLGYAGTVVVVLASLQYWREWLNSNRRDWGALTMVLICLASALMTSSRGALIYDLLMIGVAWRLVRHFQNQADKGVREERGCKKSRNRKWYVIAWVISALMAITLLGKTIAKDERWQLMSTKMQAGWMVADPVYYMCHGFKEGEREHILGKLGVQDHEMAEKIMAGFEQDGARVLLHQVGWQLVKENPLGIDGSRQSYEKAIAVKCGGQPAHTFAHAHNGWINLALSFGWLGALLYFALLAHMAQQGWKYASAGLALPWSTALFLVSFFWIIRGVTDACYQDHYLQMQGVLLGFLYMRARLEAEKEAKDVMSEVKPA